MSVENRVFVEIPSASGVDWWTHGEEAPLVGTAEGGMGSTWAGAPGVDPVRMSTMVINELSRRRDVCSWIELRDSLLASVGPGIEPPDAEKAIRWALAILVSVGEVRRIDRSKREGGVAYQISVDHVDLSPAEKLRRREEWFTTYMQATFDPYA